MVKAINKNLILDSFCSFYQEIANIKLILREGNYKELLTEKNNKKELRENDLAAVISRKLELFLSNQKKITRENTTDSEYKIYHSAQYVMASLADELFLLEIDWPGAEQWDDHLLERKLFKTMNAGQMVFRRLNKLLNDRSSDPLLSDLASVYLMALRLGFRGQYRGKNGRKVLEVLRIKLLQFIGAGGEAELRKPAFFKAYQYRLSGEIDQRLAPLAPWFKASAVAFISYLLFAYLAWDIAIDPLKKYLV